MKKILFVISLVVFLTIGSTVSFADPHAEPGSECDSTVIEYPIS